MDVSQLPLAEKLVKGQEIINKSSGNPAVPGNTAVLAAFSSAQAALESAMNGEISARGTVTQRKTVRANALETWIASLNGLAALTESATEGDAAAIESTGFGCARRGLRHSRCQRPRGWWRGRMARRAYAAELAAFARGEKLYGAEQPGSDHGDELGLFDELHDGFGECERRAAGSATGIAWRG